MNGDEWCITDKSLTLELEAESKSDVYNTVNRSCVYVQYTTQGGE